MSKIHPGRAVGGIQYPQTLVTEQVPLTILDRAPEKGDTLNLPTEHGGVTIRVHSRAEETRSTLIFIGNLMAIATDVCLAKAGCTYLWRKDNGPIATVPDRAEGGNRDQAINSA